MQNSQNPLSYYAANLKKDFPSGLVVFLVALPLCLGISLASGAPLFSGIITGIVGGLIVSLLSGSSLSVSGPAAGLTVIVFDGIHELKTFETFLLAGFIAGALQIILGFAKAGVIGMYFPSAVIRGMLSAIGLTLILKQLPYFLGMEKEALKHVSLAQPSSFSALFTHLDMGAMIIGLVSLAVLIAWGSKPTQRFSFFKLIPGALFVVVGSIFANLAFRAFRPEWAVDPSHLVTLPVLSSPGAIVNHLKFPDFSQITNPAVYVVAFTIAIIASLETLLSVEAVDKLDPQKRTTPTNRELKAQGVGNMIASAIGGLPMTAVIVRSSANINAGGQTRMSSFIHGIFLLLSVFVLSKYLNLVPLSALAAVLLTVGFKLATPALFKAQWKLGLEQFIPFVVTIAAILATDLLIGICIGLVVGVFFILKANFKAPYSLDKKEHPEHEVIRIELGQTTTFLNKASIVKALEELPETSKVTIDGSNSTFIDYDVLEAIHEFKKTSGEKRIQLHLVDIPEVANVSHH